MMTLGSRSTGPRPAQQKLSVNRRETAHGEVVIDRRSQAGPAVPSPKNSMSLEETTMLREFVRYVELCIVFMSG
jgi:hypothetical protein